MILELYPFTLAFLMIGSGVFGYFLCLCVRVYKETKTIIKTDKRNEKSENNKDREDGKEGLLREYFIHHHNGQR